MPREDRKGIIFGNYTKAIRGDDGNWTVTTKLWEKVTDDGEEWREEFFESIATEKTFDLAHTVVLREVLQAMQDFVYSRGFDSLVDAVDYQRTLEASNDSEATINEDTPS